MDNECSDDLKAALSKAGLIFQLVPPHIHRGNKSERAIQTFKGHLKAGLAFELTLNLLRAS